MELLRIEILKNFKNVKFLIMFALFFLFMLLFYIQANIIVQKLASQSIYSFPDVWHRLAYVTRIFSYILGVIAVTIITNEIRYKTLRQNIIDGMSRGQFLASKLIFMGIISVITMILLFAFGMVYGLQHTPNLSGDMIWEKFIYVPLTGLYVFGFMALCFLIGLLVKRTGMAVVVIVLYMGVLEPMLRYKFNLPYYVLPGWSIGSLITSPTDAFGGKLDTNVIFVAITMIGLVIGGCYFTLKKRDL